MTYGVFKESKRVLVSKDSDLKSSIPNKRFQYFESPFSLVTTCPWILSLSLFMRLLPTI